MGPTRPADLLLHTLDARPTAVDVTISHPLRLSGTPAVRAEAGVSASLAEAAKVSTSGAACEAAGWTQRPFAMETTGALGKSATKVFKRLVRQISMRSGSPPGETWSNLAQQLSVALAKGCAEMLVSSFHSFQDPC
jgi:hypothetical protein